ncbi:uncharacterized protein [Nicotiana sylvestris]|uniref:uncharacterized protein n=1 Tax=Nicotiana sylvestris TaxID=4096 RepID=UPI00388C4D35
MSVNGELYLKIGIGESLKARPCPLAEGERPPASGLRDNSNNNKQERPLQDDSDCSKMNPARRLREGVSAERDRVPNRCSSTGVDGARSVDVRSTLEEAQRLYSELKSKLLRRKARLQKAIDGEKSLRLLCDEKEDELARLQHETNQSSNYESFLKEQKKTEDVECLWSEVGQAKCEYDELKARADVEASTEKGALAKASAFEVQLCLARDDSLVRVDMITKLESELLKIKAEVVDARAEAVMSRTKVDKKVIVYLEDGANDQVELRRTLDREGRSKEYARCKSRRETLEDIYARGFDLSKKIKRAKAKEYDAKLLLSDAEDSEKEADGP